MRAARSLARPPALVPGDHVAVVAASSPVPADRLELGLQTLRFAGLEPVVLPSARATGTVRTYLAGTDAQRSGDLTDALLDPQVAGVLFARGGVGAQRMLETLDWSRFAGVAPKVLSGFSDVTAVLEAVAVRLGWATVHAAMLTSNGPGTQYSLASLLRMLMAPERATQLEFRQSRPVVGGRARGVTLGGNLCLLTSSLGTSTSRPADGGILLLEDESEEDYRVDRMLTQLRRSGYLDGVAGIVAGSFSNCGPPEVIEDILNERLGHLGVPMIVGADIGHGGPNQAFPIGIAAELDADAGTVRLLDPPLVPRT